MTELQIRFTSFIKKALVNDSIDYYRKVNKRNKFEFTSILDESVNLKVSISQDSDIDTFSFDKLNYIELSNSKLFFSMSKLTEREFKIITMYCNGYKPIEISKELEMTDSSTRTAIYKIKKKIKKYMEE